MRALLCLAFLLALGLLAGCSDDPASAGDEASLRFEAQVSGDRDFALAGDALHGAYATEFVVAPPGSALGTSVLLTTRSPLDYEEGGHTIHLFLRDASPGSYAVGMRSEASAIFSEQSDSLWTMASGARGTVTLQEVTSERIRGTFRFQTEQAMMAPLVTYDRSGLPLDSLLTLPGDSLRYHLPDSLLLDRPALLVPDYTRMEYQPLHLDIEGSFDAGRLALPGGLPR